MTESIRTDRDGAVAIITMDRTSRRNALDVAALRALATVVDELSADETVRAIVLTGAGEHFCAGADIAELRDLEDRASARAHARIGQAACNALEHSPLPIVAAIDGFCVGGGLELAMSCDLRIAGTTARFGQVELGIGSVAAWGGMRRLPRLVGVATAKHLVYTREHVDADTALQLGLIHEVVADAGMRATSLAGELASAPREALTASKRALDHWFDVPLQAGLEQDRETFALLSTSPGFQEGVAAFLSRSDRK
jgi:enoyl-CoA hydratase